MEGVWINGGGTIKSVCFQGQSGLVVEDERCFRFHMSVLLGGVECCMHHCLCCVKRGGWVILPVSPLLSSPLSSLPHPPFLLPLAPPTLSSPFHLPHSLLPFCHVVYKGASAGHACEHGDSWTSSLILKSRVTQPQLVPLIIYVYNEGAGINMAFAKMSKNSVKEIYGHTPEVSTTGVECEVDGGVVVCMCVLNS